jgi:hypothetical protein
MKISIVTPSFNEDRFLERSMRSVLAQEVEDLEYVVIDGGSTDESAETIRRQAGHLAFWESRPEDGYTGILQAAFERTKGEIMGWVHPGEELTPWALRAVEGIFDSLPDVEWLTTAFPLAIDDEQRLVSAGETDGFNADAFYRGWNIPSAGGGVTGVIHRVSTFWRRSLWERAGGRLEEGWRTAVDFELWARFFQYARLHAGFIPIGCSRLRGNSLAVGEEDTLAAQCRTVLRRFGRKPPSWIESAARRVICHFPRRTWPYTGLAYPAAVVRPEKQCLRWVLAREWIV